MKFNNDETKMDKKKFDLYKNYLKQITNITGDDADYDGHRKEDDENDSVTNRVAGFILKKVLSEHTSCVTSLVVIERPDLYPARYLISGGWDKRVAIWDLDRLRLFDLFRNASNNFEEVEIASDGNILDMCYCEKHNYFGYASTDSMCYIRKFSTRGSEMTLVNTLQGHLSEVNCIRWYSTKSLWVTGGEDTTIRIWNEDCDCIQVINCGGTVNTICLDLVQDVIISACHDVIKVFEMEDYHLVQTNYGHHDSIRDLIFIPERNHIVSVSWDKTIRVWKSYRKQNYQRKNIENDNNKKFDTWVWEKMKQALKTERSFDISSYSDRLS